MSFTAKLLNALLFASMIVPFCWSLCPGPGHLPLCRISRPGFDVAGGGNPRHGRGHTDHHGPEDQRPPAVPGDDSSPPRDGGQHGGLAATVAQHPNRQPDEPQDSAAAEALPPVVNATSIAPCSTTTNTSRQSRSPPAAVVHQRVHLRVSGRPNAGKRSGTKTVTSATAPSSTRSTASPKARYLEPPATRTYVPTAGCRFARVGTSRISTAPGPCSAGAQASTIVSRPDTRPAPARCDRRLPAAG